MVNYDNRFGQQNQLNVVNGLRQACAALGIKGMPNAVPVLQKDPSGHVYANVSPSIHLSGTLLSQTRISAPERSRPTA